MNKQIAFLGWNHPAEKSFEKLAKQGWIAVLIVPEIEDWRSEGVLSIASKYNIKVEQRISEMKKYSYDIVVCSNYPKLIPEKWLKNKIGINCHWSLLPKYRGMHSTAWALINGEKNIGQSLHFMEGGFDTGDIIVQSYVEVKDEMQITDIFLALSELEANNLFMVISKYFKSGTISRTKQNEELATYVPQRTIKMGRIDWDKPSQEIWNLTRALPVHFYPPAFTYLEDKIIEIIELEIIDSAPYKCIPGVIVRVEKNIGVSVKTGDSVLLIKKVRFFGENSILNADDVLKRGMHLGINLEDEVFEMKKIIGQLSKKIRSLEELLSVTK
jgi:methionyl-tRNA formyltransferase